MLPLARLLSISALNPPAVNYGTLGFVVGHELSHSVDPFNWHKAYGLGPRQYFEQALCIVDQYGGVDTTNDDFCDISGVQIDYRALTNHLGQEGMDQSPVATFSWNNRQIFFMSGAYDWCTRLPPDDDDDHSLPSLRVLNSLKNTVEFANAFNCHLGSPMNPVDKCRIWWKDRNIYLFFVFLFSPINSISNFFCSKICVTVVWNFFPQFFWSNDRSKRSFKQKHVFLIALGWPRVGRFQEINQQINLKTKHWCNSESLEFNWENKPHCWNCLKNGQFLDLFCFQVCVFLTNFSTPFFL